MELYDNAVKQRVIPVEEHQLSPEKIDPHALYVMEKLRDAGFIAYLVGGSVRDLLLGETPKDFDISTSALPEDVKKIFRNCILIGRRFRLAHVRFGKKIIEVATFRSGNIETEELILRDNEWGRPEEDALRRDFTINGLFYDPASQTIIDFVNGWDDIQKKVLRTIGLPYVRFKQDPVRMIRLLKFKARFKLDIDEEAHQALLECRTEIVKSAPARVLEEMLRMLESGSARAFLHSLSDHGMLGQLLPILSDFLETERGAEVYEFLEEIDGIVKDPQIPSPERAILMSSLFYPILDERIENRFLSLGKMPHLGQIQSETNELLHELFDGFFALPRRLRLSVGSILSHQYRLTPLAKQNKGRRRVPSDPEFFSAVQFLAIRSCLEPGLTEVLEEWQKLLEGNTPPERGTKPRKRRRRRRRSDQEPLPE